MLGPWPMPGEMPLLCIYISYVHLQGGDQPGALAPSASQSPKVTQQVAGGIRLVQGL